MASKLEWMPDTLHNSCITAVATHHFLDKRYFHCREEICRLPPCVQFDIFYKAFQIGKLCHIGFEMRDLQIFSKLARCGSRRHLLHHMFQALMDHGLCLSRDLQSGYTLQCEAVDKSDVRQVRHLITTGLVLNNFLTEAGWYQDCEKVLETCLSLCQVFDEAIYWTKALECCVRLLHVRISFYKFLEADSTIIQSHFYTKKLLSCSRTPNLATLYAQFSSLYFGRSLYDKSYEYSLKALDQLQDSLPKAIIIDVLRQIGKVCLIKRKFKQAELVLLQAVCHARDQYGIKHVKYSDALLDFSYFLLNIDNICLAVQCYQRALDIRMQVFGGNNLHVATAHENLAYATYVHEYSSGRFCDAHEHSNRAMDILVHILPSDHMLVASCRRVKALILEEIAIDSNDSACETKMLSEALDLHMTALKQSLAMFGEDNVQTAKHYGNLGRLYQSMKRFEEAESMHLKAIAIKEKLLTNDNHEVALSVGHLASLYNYDMERYDEAEQLYLRSIAIGKLLFGEKYSGLEYDYRGLHRLYSQKGDMQKASQYSLILQEWSQLREHDAEDQQNMSHMLHKPVQTLDKIKTQFHHLDQILLNPTRPTGS